MKVFFFISFVALIVYFIAPASAVTKCPEPMRSMIGHMFSKKDGAKASVLNVHVIDGGEERLYSISRAGRVSVESGSIHGPPSVLRYNIFTTPPGLNDCTSLVVNSDSVRGMNYMRNAVFVMLYGVCFEYKEEMVLGRFAGNMARSPDKWGRDKKRMNSISKECPSMVPILQEIGAYKNWMLVEKQDRVQNCRSACGELMRFAPKGAEFLNSMCPIMCR